MLPSSLRRPARPHRLAAALALVLAAPLPGLAGTAGAAAAEPASVSTTRLVGDAAPAPAQRAVVSRNLTRDGGFEGPNAWRRTTNANFVVYRSRQLSSTSTPRSGVRYGATNTRVRGGSIYQDSSVQTTAGQTLCATAWVRTQTGATGAAGTFAVWLLNGASNENGSVNFSGLGNGWTQVRTCVEATTSHSVLRLQLYPRPGGPTVDIDDVDVHRSFARDGGFELGNGWRRTASTNFVTYRSASARSGARYGATNTSASGGSIYQDTTGAIGTGETFCAIAYVRTQAGATGAAGTFAVWMLGGAYNENGSQAFSQLGNGWSQLRTCVQATTDHTGIRIQLYPKPGGRTVDIDDVDVHASVARDGGFEGPNAWAVRGSTNYVSYRNGQVAGESARSGVGYGATNTSSAGGSIYQDNPISTVVGQTYCASAHVKSQVGATGAAGTFAVWLLGGAYEENGSTRFTTIGNGWGIVQTCVQATTSHSSLRIEFYPKVNGPTLTIDNVDVH
ncbi:MAG: hypothetical protein JWN84_822 [Nocardioides sp.]|nr:hypothetical protein [Nocardioides sp.]